MSPLELFLLKYFVQYVVPWLLKKEHITALQADMIKAWAWAKMNVKVSSEPTDFPNVPPQDTGKFSSQPWNKKAPHGP